MKSDSQGAFRRSAMSPRASALALVILASAGPALANGDRGNGVPVSGNSTISDSCGIAGSDIALQMTGDLEGCLSVFVQGYSCTEQEGFDLYSERGREVFVGTLNGKQGSFRTTYTLDGVYAKGFCQSFDFGLQVGGGCTHKVQGRTGVFEDAAGVIKFIDVIANVTGDPVTGEFTAGTGANNFLYFGRMHLQQD